MKTTRHAAANGVEIAVHEAGSGPAVVFVHGSGPGASGGSAGGSGGSSGGSN